MTQDCAGPVEPIAIVGMACRLPGGNNSPDEFWEFLLSRGCGIREIPQDRFNAERFYDENPEGVGKTSSKWAGFLSDIKGFDSGFFGISPREADSMDPQQRLMLQTAYEALQDTGVPVSSYSDIQTGLFVGVSQSDYRTIQEARSSSREAFAGTGYALCINANRISHRLNLSGPSLIVDTACSSSMVALNQAVQSLRMGGCDAAIVGGVNILAHPSSFVAFSRAGMLSKTGVVSTFDKNANGFVRGEGVGAVVLKPLSRAKEDGDRIHAVIHATAANQDGRTSTITAPSQEAQVAMLADLFETSGITPDQVGYVEAHGTGTPVGDPIEAGAIGQVIGQGSPDHPVFIGSGKANVGHGEPAAGITGLIKAVLTVRNGMVPPSINFETPNPNIPFKALNLQVATKPEPFPTGTNRRFAVINSFGFGGANGSALISSVEEPVAEVDAPVAHATGFPLFFPVSGASQEGLLANVVALRDALMDNGSLAATTPGELSAALAHNREHLSHRAVFLAGSMAELREVLNVFVAADGAPEERPDIVTGRVSADNKLAFMFSGQGSQWWGMARQFLESDPVFARAVDDYDAHFIKAAGWSIKQELLKDEAESRIDDTTITQPALFAIQSGLAAVWARFGIKPDMVVGHSIGEAAASYVAGGLSLSGAARFLSKRGAIRDQLGARGSMAALGLGVEDVEAILPEDGKIGIAAINGPGSTTISGDYEALHDFVEDFSIRNPNTLARILKVDTAWHSYQLEGGESWFRKEVPSIDFAVPTLPFISTVTGKPEVRFDVEYAWLNLRKPVNFQAGIETALDYGATVFVELGPHATLAGPTVSTALAKGAQVEVLNSISRKESDFSAFSKALASLFVRGIEPDWTALVGARPSHVDLPRQSWQNEDHWHDSEEARTRLFSPPSHPFLGDRSEGVETSWRSEINTQAYPFLKDHRLQAETIFPGAGYVDMLFALGRELFGDVPLEITDALIYDALFLADGKAVLLNSVYSSDRSRAQLYSHTRDSKDDWTLRSEGFVRPTDVAPPKPPKFDPTAKSVKEVDLEFVYDVDEQTPFVNYGSDFQVIRKLWMTGRKTVAQISMTDGIRNNFGRFLAHPALLDGCLQVTDPRMSPKSILQKRKAGDPIALPIGFRRMRFYAPLPSEIMVHASRSIDTKSGEAAADFTVTDMEGNVLLTADGLMMKALETKAAKSEEDDVRAHFVRETQSEIQDDFQVDLPVEGEWIVVSHSARPVQQLINGLKQSGARVTRLGAKEIGESLSEALSSRFEDQFEAGDITGIIYAGGLSMPDMAGDIPSDDMLAPIERHVSELISLGDLMDLYRVEEVQKPRIVVLTRALQDKGSPDILAQKPLVSVGRVLATETPEYDVRLIAADAENLANPDRLVRAMLCETNESELTLCKDRIEVPRLRVTEQADFASRMISVAASDRSTNFHASMVTPGSIDDLTLFEIPLAPCGADQVRIRVSTVGLNFRDIMAVTGLLPKEAEEKPAWQNLGLEFGAVVEEVGANVTGFKPGDRVMGMQKHCLQRFLTLDPVALSHVPDHLSLEDAATIPSAFATAHYALNHIGRMQENEKVLIHVATGGVGSAAVQLAQAAGAEIFATAGSPKKRKHLKELGVPHVMDSRSLKFADDVERISKGKGVDLLLNSLPADYISKGLDIVAPYGRFLEIGKRDVYTDSSIGMKALRKNVSFSVLDLAAMGLERPDLLSMLMRELVEKFEARALQPLETTVFPVSRIADAFRFMSQAKQIGKVVLSFEEDHFDVRRDPERPVRLAENASYLVTGGTKGFGLTIADWLSRSGAGEVILASRSGVVEPHDARFVRKMEKRGTRVECLSLDIADSAEVEAFVASRSDSEFPLRGVVHGAAVIKDGFVTQQTPEMISDVLRPKVLGGWNLHRAFEKAGYQPDFLIGFSSIAQVIGSGGQANYVAANAFLEALAQHRSALGLEGTAINWGAMAESGFVARSAGMANYLESVGLHGLTDKETDAGMELALSRETSHFVYSRADWEQIGRANTALGNSARFATLLSDVSGGDSEIRARLLSLEGEELIAAAIEFVKGELSSVLKVDKSAIHSDRPMNELGLDSLSSFELKMRVETALGLTLPVSKFLKAPSIDELAGLLEEEIAALRLAEAEKASGGADDGEAEAGGAGATEQALRASQRQLALLRVTTSPLSSDESRLAVQHCIEWPLTEAHGDKDVQKIIDRITKRHAALRTRFETVAGDDLVQFDAELPELQKSTGSRILDAGAGELLRFEREPDRLRMVVHQAIADQASVDVLSAEIDKLLQGQTLSGRPRNAVLKRAMQELACDPDSDRGQSDRAFWWYSLAAGARPVAFETRKKALLPAHLGRNRGVAREVCGILPGAPERGDLLVKFAASLRSITQTQGAVLINLLTSYRGQNDLEREIGQFDLELPLIVPDTWQDRRAREQMERVLANAMDHVGFDGSSAAQTFAENFAKWEINQTQFAMCFEDDDTEQTFSSYDVLISIKGNQFRLIYDSDALSSELAEQLAGMLEKACK